MIKYLISLAERGVLPDNLLRFGIRHLLKKRLSSLIDSNPETNKQNKIKFYVPEEIFMKQKVDYTPICKDNSQIFVNEYYENYENGEENLQNIEYPVPIKEQEIVVMCGLPGSGKSKVAFDIYGKQTNYIIFYKFNVIYIINIANICIYKSFIFHIFFNIHKKTGRIFYFNFIITKCRFY